LRDLLDDPVTDLRERAATTLAQRHDPATQQVLIDGLRSGGPLPVDRVQAILLLAEDDHLDNLPRLTELYAHESADAREQAVRFMGSYPAARPALEGVLRDKTEEPSVREQSAASLRYLAPERAEAVAKEIVADPTDDAEVRTACLAALQHLGDATAVYGDAEFVRRVREAGADENAPRLARVARDFLARGDQS
jgi:HEAT repeat protein